MQTILLIMRRKPIAQSLANKLQSRDVHVAYEPEYDHAQEAIRSHNAGVVLIEAAESGLHNTAYCLALCKQLRTTSPQCRLLLMCPEQDKKSVLQAVDAKRENRIDDFVFYDVTIDYLATKMMSM